MRSRARRWGLWLYCAAYMQKYAGMTTVNARKAVAVVGCWCGEPKAGQAALAPMRALGPAADALAAALAVSPVARRVISTLSSRRKTIPSSIARATIFT